MLVKCSVVAKLADKTPSIRLSAAENKYMINNGDLTHFGDLPINVLRRHGDVGPSSPWSNERTDRQV